MNLDALNRLIVDTAICQIAVDEFEPDTGENAQLTLAQARSELADCKLALIDTILSAGPFLRLLIAADYASTAGDIDLSKMTREERRKVLFGK